MPLWAFDELAKRRVHLLAQLLEATERTLAGDMKGLEASWKDLERSHPSEEEKNEYADTLSDERSDLETVRRDAHLFHILGLYHAVERFLGVIFEWRLSGVPVADRDKILHRLHKWRDLNELTDTYFGFDIEKVPCFATVNRLRLVTNAVKHKGDRVSEELQKVTRWKRHEPIEPTRLGDLEKVRSRCLCFLKTYAQRAERGTTRKFGPALKKQKTT